MLNSCIFSETVAIVLLPDLQNQYPANFPANVQQIRVLNGLYDIKIQS